jgi:hypothetical protein
MRSRHETTQLARILAGALALLACMSTSHAGVVPRAARPLPPSAPRRMTSAGSTCSDWAAGQSSFRACTSRATRKRLTSTSGRWCRTHGRISRTKEAGLDLSPCIAPVATRRHRPIPNFSASIGSWPTSHLAMLKCWRPTPRWSGRAGKRRPSGGRLVGAPLNSDIRPSRNHVR